MPAAAQWHLDLAGGPHIDPSTKYCLPICHACRPLPGGVQLSGGSLTSAEGCLTHVFAKAEDRQMLLNVLLHCADVSNPVKPAAVAEQ